jgi:hypothetical protein
MSSLQANHYDLQPHWDMFSVLCVEVGSQTAQEGLQASGTAASTTVVVQHANSVLVHVHGPVLIERYCLNTDQPKALDVEAGNATARGKCEAAAGL